MGLVYADIELINVDDQALAKRHFLDKEDVKKINVTMLVDSGAYNLCINEVIQEQLDLSFVEKRKAQMVDGSTVEFDVVGPILLKFKNRQTVCNAFVLAGDSEPLLGAIPMEDLDVIIHPTRNEMMVNPDHPNYAQMKLKGMRR
jgi:clan AA aspartic protease